MTFDHLHRRASVATLGGFRPSDQLTASWGGRVRVALADETWPTTDNAPMIPVLQVNVTELPERPPALDDTSIVTLFLGPQAIPIDQPNGNNWELRTYPLDADLVELEQPAALPAPDPKAARGSQGTPTPLPVRWTGVDDYPSRDELPDDLLGAYDDLDDDAPQTAEGIKIGGWPFCVQSEVIWPDNADVDFAIQIDTNTRIGISAGYGAIFYIGRDRSDPTRWHFTHQSM